jgi:predicted membrane protein
MIWIPVSFGICYHGNMNIGMLSEIWVAYPLQNDKIKLTNYNFKNEKKIYVKLNG